MATLRRVGHGDAAAVPRVPASVLPRPPLPPHPRQAHPTHHRPRPGRQLPRCRGGYLLLGLRRESLAPLVDAALYLALFSALLAAEVLFFKALALAAAAGLTACALHDCVVFRDCARFRPTSPAPARYLSFAALGLAFLAFRKLALIRAIRAAAADRARHDAAWQAARRRPGAAETLARLAVLAVAMAARCAPGDARQYNRRRRRGPAGGAAAADACILSTATGGAAVAIGGGLGAGWRAGRTRRWTATRRRWRARRTRTGP
jgi:hypothetical protein